MKKKDIQQRQNQERKNRKRKYHFQQLMKLSLMEKELVLVPI